MSIEISQNRCIACARCMQVCPGSLIYSDKDGKAYIPKPERCWGCTACVKECPAESIALYLGRDIGGLGGKMTVKKEKHLLHWRILKPDGQLQVITVDSRNANQY